MFLNSKASMNKTKQNSFKYITFLTNKHCKMCIHKINIRTFESPSFLVGGYDDCCMEFARWMEVEYSVDRLDA